MKCHAKQTGFKSSGGNRAESQVQQKSFARSGKIRKRVNLPSSLNDYQRVRFAWRACNHDRLLKPHAGEGVLNAKTLDRRCIRQGNHCMHSTIEGQRYASE
jgi:hypothetical protein